MGIPVVETYEKNNGGITASSTLTCNKPSGVVSGDLLVLIPMNEDAGNTPQFSDNKTGWTFAGTSGNASSDCHIGCFYRIADGNEGTSESVTAQSSDQWCMFYIRISGADSSSTVNVSNFTQSSLSTSSHQIPSVTTNADNCLVLYGLAFDGADGYPFSVSGTGWSEGDEERAGTGGGYVSGCWGQRDLASYGASGNATVTCSAYDGAAYFQLAINGGINEYEESFSANTGLISSISAEFQLYKLEGITYDKNGNILGSCDCYLFKDNLDDTISFIGHTISNAVTGEYSFTGIYDNNAQYLVVAIKDDTPHVFDVTDHVLQPVEET